ncbi:uncharacterized protein LOC113331390 [Papaver somniferum]|uniref:uncharacterized protein LOC113331390 n=1 Tax=Papaver somniferum TaxID=3469 RepID=UPI000E6FFC38|nr:uncharacterized protein LOC113331390 [Papaver somniferum]
MENQDVEREEGDDGVNGGDGGAVGGRYENSGWFGGGEATVDDIIVTGSNPSLIDKLITDLEDVFAVKDMGKLSYFLGVEVISQGRNMFLTQRKHVADLLRKTKLDGIKHVCTLLAAQARLQKQGSVKFEDPTLYRSVVGVLHYLHLTRPDISVVVNKACQFMHDPYVEH